MIEEPLFTTEMEASDFQLPDGSTLIYGLGEEERSQHVKEWIQKGQERGISSIRIDQLDTETVRIFSGGGPGTVLYLHDTAELSGFLAGLSGPVYLDITALLHRTWAPLLKAGLCARDDLKLIYLEPRDYHRSVLPTPGKIYNLSDRIGGIAPLPGFARLSTGDNVGSYFVPMVGFEGPRLEQVISGIETQRNRTVPIIGLPGFRPEFPFYAYATNRHSLELEYLHNKVTFVKANCPFHAFQTLSLLHRESGHQHIRIAPIGTKPHAVGAVLYAISRGSKVEIIYDHPVKSPKRTSGEGRICVYDVSSFATTKLFKVDASIPADPND